jgi:hypothetical protein
MHIREREGEKEFICTHTCVAEELQRTDNIEWIDGRTDKRFNHELSSLFLLAICVLIF